MSVYGPPHLYFKPLKLLNFDLNADLFMLASVTYLESGVKIGAFLKRLSESVVEVVFLFQFVPCGMPEHGAAGGEILLRQLRERSHATL